MRYMAMFWYHHFNSYADLNEMTLETCYNSFSVDLYENKLCIQKMQREFKQFKIVFLNAFEIYGHVLLVQTFAELT